jgi:hypothetical protein
MELFEDNKKKALALKAEIDKTDKEIDQMVYALYGFDGGGDKDCLRCNFVVWRVFN